MRVTTVIVGAGHAGLAISRHLTERSIDHVLLERGEVANSWRTERWESLRLLTPRWQTRLPGLGRIEGDPDGFMTAPELVGALDRYASTIDAPVHTRTTVTSLRPAEGGFEVVTDEGVWRCRTVVVASGACNRPRVPALAAAIPSSIRQVTPMSYAGPNDLDPGGVLVVGASATGVQLADEIRRSGRQVTLAVGEHVRAPRTYRGRDVLWWLDATGLLDESYRDVDDLVRARSVPSPQLTGSDDRRDLDLNTLSAAGVRLVGRLAGVHDGEAQFSGSLPNVCALADLKMHRLLTVIDDWAAAGLGDPGVDSGRPEPTRLPAEPTIGTDLTGGEIRTVVWATGYRPDYSWLDVPVLDHRGHIRHDGGVVTGAPGMYVMGLQFLRRRKSHFIDGAGPDARDLSARIAAFLGGRAGGGAQRRGETGMTRRRRVPVPR